MNRAEQERWVKMLARARAAKRRVIAQCNALQGNLLCPPVRAYRDSPLRWCQWLAARATHRALIRRLAGFKARH